jgi:hypothetical protein
MKIVLESKKDADVLGMVLDCALKAGGIKVIQQVNHINANVVNNIPPEKKPITSPKIAGNSTEEITAE